MAIIMDEAAARKVAGAALRDVVMARAEWERVETGRVYALIKASFRETYGDAAWRAAVDAAVLEYGLEPHIFDLDALRDE